TKVDGLITGGLQELLDQVFIIGVATRTQADVGAAEAASRGIDKDGDEAVFSVLVINNFNDVLRAEPVYRLAGDFRKVFHLELQSSSFGSGRGAEVTPRAEALRGIEIDTGCRNARGSVVGAEEAVGDGAGKEDKGRVAKVEVDKKLLLLRALDKSGALVAVYPASIGSGERPAPSGTLTVRAIAMNPGYTYNPKYKFEGVKSDKPFEIAPGPNNPVGSVWIALDREGYGIHGTPDPDKVSKSYSHGCVRLTNWDAEELARMVDKGTTVAFIE
ncbi:MAG: hypothetical protein M1823_006424, partial [Watsoniomyces obsoletus]